MSYTPEEREQVYAIAEEMVGIIHRISKLTMIPQQKIVENVAGRFCDSIKKKGDAK